MAAHSRSDSEVRVHPTLEDLMGLQYQAKGFSYLPRQPVDSLLAGRHNSRLRGRGLSFAELRDYRPGDDIRSIDWKATARLRSPYIRVYSEERERPVLLLVDQRSSMFFGSRRTTKAGAAAEVAALSAWRVLQAKDRVGAILFGDDELVQIRPRRSRENVTRICSELVRLNEKLSATSPKSSKRNLNAALQRALNVALHDYLVVLITDYTGADGETEKLCTSLAAHNDVLAVMTYDPLGIRLPDSAELQITDGEEILAVPQGERFSESYEEAFRARVDSIKGILGSIRIPILPICTHEAVCDQILDALGAPS